VREDLRDERIDRQRHERTIVAAAAGRSFPAYHLRMTLKTWSSFALEWQA
jgi:hypothetical protein